MEEINKDLRNYIENNILPKYKNFDKAHQQHHVFAVIARSFSLCQRLNLNVDYNMVYTIASYHDVGCVISRINHPRYSKEILLADRRLKNWFSDEQIKIMAEACEDHSTSSINKPRTIYGKIVSDADKDLDVKNFVLRSWEFSLHYSPEMTYEEHVDDLYNEILKRYGDESEGGRHLAVFYLPTEETENFVKNIKKFIASKKLMEQMLIKYLGEEE